MMRDVLQGDSGSSGRSCLVGPERLWIVLTLGLSIAVGLAAGLIGSAMSGTTFLVSVLVAGLAATLIYQFVASVYRGHWLQPYTFYAIVYSGYAVSGAYLLTGARGMLGVSLNEFSPQVSLSLVWVLLGAWAFWLGYRSHSEDKENEEIVGLTFPELSRKWVIWIIVLFLLGAGILGYIRLVESSGGLDYLIHNIIRRSYLRSSGYSVLLALQTNVAIWVWMTYDKKFSRRLTAWIALLLVAGAMLVLGNRTPIIQFLVVVYVFGDFRGRRKNGTGRVIRESKEADMSDLGDAEVRSRRPSRRGSPSFGAVLGLTFLGAVVLVMLFVFTAWRDLSSPAMQGVSLTERVDALMEPESASELIFASGNLATLEVFVRIVEAVPVVMDYQYGRSFLEFFLTPIPRAWWSEKPVSLGLRLNRLFVSQGAIGGTPPSIVGELYLNFHFVGVLVGMFLLGQICRFAYRRWIVKKGHNPASVVSYAVFVAYLIMSWIRTDFSTALGSWLWVYVPYSLVLKLVEVCCPKAGSR